MVNVEDLGLHSCGEPYIMKFEDYDALLADLGSENFPFDAAGIFVVRQATTKLRTWTQNKELKKATQKDRGFLKGRVARMVDGGAKRPGRAWRKRMTIRDIKARTFCHRCNQKGHWQTECKEPPSKEFNVNWGWLEEADTDGGFYSFL